MGLLMSVLASFEPLVFSEMRASCSVSALQWCCQFAPTNRRRSRVHVSPPEGTAPSTVDGMRKCPKAVNIVALRRANHTHLTPVSRGHVFNSLLELIHQVLRPRICTGQENKLRSAISGIPPTFRCDLPKPRGPRRKASSPSSPESSLPLLRSARNIPVPRHC